MSRRLLTAVTLTLALATPSGGAIAGAPTAAAPAPLPRTARADATTAFYAVVRPGVMHAFVRAARGYGFDGKGSGGWTLSVAGGRWLDEHFGLELEGGYQRPGAADGVFVFGFGGSAPEYRDATLGLTLVPITVNVRVRGSASSTRPYLLVGAGVARMEVEIVGDPRPGIPENPPDEERRLREHALTAFAQVGAGLELDLGGRFFAGVELRCFATPDAALTDGILGVIGAGGSVLVGARL